MSLSVVDEEGFIISRYYAVDRMSINNGSDKPDSPPLAFSVLDGFVANVGID